ncbi:MAG: hypothetical protein AAF467_01755 [Actinomycetota bacterium]
MVTRTRQRFITISLLVLAGIAMTFAIAYQGERLPDGPSVVGNVNNAANGGVPTADTVVVTGPIEGFLPRSGEGTACREPVGVDLAPGFGATLTINGIAIAPEEMNVNLDPEGNPTGVVTASRSLDQYTFGPEPNCPDGRVIRATDNLVQACIYRLEDGPGTCTLNTEFTFDAL